MQAIAMNNSLDLTQQPIPYLLRKLATPVGTGFFFSTMFNAVDTYYGGRISTKALAALSLSFPLFFVILAMATGIAMATTAITGHNLGAGNREEAELHAAQALSFALIHALMLTAFGLVAAPTVFRLLGAEGDYLRHALDYMNVMFGGAVFFIGNHTLNALLSATGDTRSFRNFLIAGFFFNLALDPVLIYGWFGLPPLGLAGIPAATVIIHMFGSIYLFTRVAKSGLISRHSWHLLAPRRAPYLKLLSQGFPASLNMLTVAIGIFIITWFIGDYGKEAVAAYGIGTRIEQIVLLPVMGLNMATLTLVAQNSGAGKFSRVRHTVRTAFRAGLAMMALGTALVFFAATPLMRLFTADPAVLANGTVFLRIEALTLGAYVVLYLNNSALQGLQKPGFALLIGLFRQIAAPTLAFSFLAHRLKLGLPGIWWGIFLVTWIAAAISIIYTRHVLSVLAQDPAPDLREPA